MYKVIITNLNGMIYGSGETDGIVIDNALFVTVGQTIKILEVYQVFKKEYSKQVWKELQPFITNEELRLSNYQQYTKNVQTKLQELSWAYGFRKMENK